MSLINQMLRDLESRQGDGLSEEAIALSNVAAPASRRQPPRASMKWLLLLVLLALLGVAAFMLWQRMQTTPPQAAAMAPPVAQAPALAPSPAPKATPKKVVVIPKPAAVVVSTPKVQPEPVRVANTQPMPESVVQPPADPAERGHAQLEDRLRAWARAWSSKDVPAYLNFYSEDFVPANGLTRSAWEAQRRQRLQGPAAIQLQLENIQLAQDGDLVRVSFTQHYDSPGYSDVTHKAMSFQQEAGVWRIREERVLPAAPERLVSGAEEQTGTGKIERRLRPLNATQQAQQQYQEGLQKLQQGKRRQAEERFQRALELDKEHVAAREAWVGMMLQSGRVVEAGQLLASGLDALPGQSQFSLLLARIHMQQGELASAAEVLETSARARSQSGDYWAMLGGIYQRMQRYNASSEAYRKALEQNPNQAVWWMGQGISMEGAGLKAQAIESYTRAEKAQGLSMELRRYVRQRLEQLGASQDSF